MIKKAIKNVCKKVFSNPQYVNLKVEREVLNELIETGYSLDEIESSVMQRLSELIKDTNLQHKQRETYANKTNLDNQYKWLDKILYCSIGKPIKLCITGGCSEEYSYTIKEYKIDGIYNSINLQLERKGDDYKVNFTEIKDIKWSGNKVWLYMKENNSRFYHYIDDIKISSLDENFKSENIELQEDIQIYMQYKNVDNLLYYVEKEKYRYRYSKNDITEKEIMDKLGNKMILLNILDEEGRYKRQGTICAYSDSGQQGVFHYQLTAEELYIIDMLPKTHSRGVGSKVLGFMEETARRYSIKELTGILSSVDFDHKDRLLYFYKKNGFTVNDLESKIRKKIN